MTATSVRTGRVEVFTESAASVAAARRPSPTGASSPPGWTLSHLMASAAIPTPLLLRARRRSRRRRGVVRRRGHPSAGATRPGARAGCRSRRGGRHRRPPRPPDPDFDRDGVAVDLGDGRRPCSARSWTIRCATTCGGWQSQRDGRGPRAGPCPQTPPRGTRPVGRTARCPTSRLRPDRRRASSPAPRWTSSAPTTAPSPHPPRSRHADHAPAPRQRQPAAGRALVLPDVRPRLLRRGLCSLGRRDAQAWMSAHPDLWTTNRSRPSPAPIHP